jgi:hypothetical protein
MLSVTKKTLMLSVVVLNVFMLSDSDEMYFMTARVNVT